mgnify:CR=1 FL=1
MQQVILWGVVGVAEVEGDELRGGVGAYEGVGGGEYQGCLVAVAGGEEYVCF